MSDSCGLSFSPSGVCPEKSRKNASFCGSICGRLCRRIRRICRPRNPRLVHPRNSNRWRHNDWTATGRRPASFAIVHTAAESSQKTTVSTSNPEKAVWSRDAIRPTLDRAAGALSTLLALDVLRLCSFFSSRAISRLFTVFGSLTPPLVCDHSRRITCSRTSLTTSTWSEWIASRMLTRPARVLT